MDMARTDVLVDILRHLPPRSLAVSRCVCTAWRATIDVHRLLRADLLPLSLDGVIFETVDMYSSPMLFSRRSTGRKVTVRLDYIDCPEGRECQVWPIMDCCSGLLLLWNHVVNPATRQWVRLPPLPPSCTVTDCRNCIDNHYLVYDPAVSPHYEVFLIPRIPFTLSLGHISMHMYNHESVSAMEWPPSPYIMHVFSSKTGCWKERSFMREGEAAGTVTDLNTPRQSENYFYYTAYWQGALYVRCERGFVLRINLLNDKYQVIKLPKGNRGWARLGKSKKGVYCALCLGRCTFRVWFLDESRGRIEWVLKNEINLEPVEKFYARNHVDDGPWILQSRGQMEWVLKNNVNIELVDDNNEALAKDDFEWDSDNENAIGTADWPRECGPNASSFECLGFHPYKEIVLFHESRRTVAYHLNSSKVRHLGEMIHQYTWIEESFSYSPCWMRDLPGSN